MTNDSQGKTYNFNRIPSSVENAFFVACDVCGDQMWDHEVRVDGDDALCRDCLDRRQMARTARVVNQIAWLFVATAIGVILAMLLVWGVPQHF